MHAVTHTVQIAVTWSAHLTPVLPLRSSPVIADPPFSAARLTPTALARFRNSASAAVLAMSARMVLSNSSSPLNLPALGGNSAEGCEPGRMRTYLYEGWKSLVRVRVRACGVCVRVFVASTCVLVG